MFSSLMFFARFCVQITVLVFLFLSACSPSPPQIPDKMVLVPEGIFVMGSDDLPGETERQSELGNKKPFYLDEHPRRTLYLGDYYIDKYEVTNRDYRAFLQEKNRRAPPYWKGPDYKVGHALLPVVETSWYEARDYCAWRGKRLPTEMEWEKAARGSEGLLYVWGNDFDATKGNVSAGSHGSIMMVGRFSQDRSVYGIYDLNGNVIEWSADWYDRYPGGDATSADFGQQFKVAKGDAYGEAGHYALSLFSRLPYRQNVSPESRLPFLGFRCGQSILEPSGLENLVSFFK